MTARRQSRHVMVAGTRGFTLVEILVATTIITVGLLAVATVFPTGYSTVTKSGAQSRGLALAQQTIEIFRNAGYDTIAAGTSVESSISGYPGYTRTSVVLNDTPAVGAKQVTVTVNLPSSQVPVQLTTVIAK